MTDARLMDADCVHGVTWWECDMCCADVTTNLGLTTVTEAYSEGDILGQMFEWNPNQKGNTDEATS